jgi:hypothetical protein
MYSASPMFTLNDASKNSAIFDAEILSKRGTGFLEESPGNRSAMRLMCMLALVAAILFGALTMVRSNGIRTTNADGTVSTVYPPRDDTGLTLTFGFLIAAFAPKAVQKFAEQRLRTYISGPAPGIPSASPMAGTPLTTVAINSPAPVPVSPAATSADSAEARLIQLLQQELAALRARQNEPAIIQTVPVSSNGTAVSAPAASPLQQIREGGSL